MTPLVEQILKSGLTGRVLSQSQIGRLLGGSDARRYGQVNRALKNGELIKPRRGLYVVNPVYQKQDLHPFVLAQQILPGSYISAESALSYHGWIPESVHTILSMTHGGKSVSYEHNQLGKFEYRRMTTNNGYFLQSVVRHELQLQIALIAEPLRALMDLVYLRKYKWKGLDFLFNGIRLDQQHLSAITASDVCRLMEVYKGQRERIFLTDLQRALEL